MNEYIDLKQTLYVKKTANQSPLLHVWGPGVSCVQSYVP